MRSLLDVRWRRILKVSTWLFMAVVLALLVRYAANVDWAQVARAVRHFRPETLAIAGAFAGANYLIYAGMDLFAREVLRTRVSKRRSMLISFVCYAFNMNFGALVGSAAFRYRLYSRFGVPAQSVTRVITIGLVTNWLGYLLLAGLVFASGYLPLPDSWTLGTRSLRAIGVLLLLALAATLVLVARAPRREWTLLGHTERLPSLPFALAQLAVSTVNWLANAAIVAVLLHPRFDYPTVLAVMLVAAVAGVVAHLPAGLGVIEGVFVALLGDRAAHADLIAALLVYRALYYLLPLMLATPLYAALEWRARHQGDRFGISKAEHESPPDSTSWPATDRQR